MTSDYIDVDAPEGTSTSHPPVPRYRTIWSRLWDAIQFVLALAGTSAFLVYLLKEPATPSVETQTQPVARSVPDLVQVIEPRLIRIQPGSPFDKHVHVVSVRRQTITDPVLTATGRVVASLRPGKDTGKDYWQFDSPEVLTAYTDWQKAQADIEFGVTQLEQVKQLAASQLEAQKKVLARAQKGVSIGDGTAREVETEKANLIQTELTGRKEIYEAESTVRMAKRAEAAAAKLLQQSGLEPELLRSATSDMDIVLADVPESRLNRVKVGQACQATFFGIPNQRFSGTVTSIAAVLSKERRSLRVLFVIQDPKDQLRPGMFAEIGLGTDPRDAIIAPADAVLHIGRADYILVGAADSHTWRVVEVQVGEPQNGDLEILDGLKEGERVIGKGAILLKPLVVRSLQLSQVSTTESRR